jgi:hypothetical protein
MSNSLIFDIEHSRDRLQYYQELKGRPGYEKSPVVHKWIEIYASRVQRLERQATRLGLKTLIRVAERGEAIHSA